MRSRTSNSARGRTAVNLDVSRHELVLDDGERLRYDRLLLTTGAEPRKLSIPGADLDGVLYLRSVEDSDALRERMDRGGAVVVIGAGWIGAEVAACARQRGLAVTVIDPNSVPLERVLGAEVGAIYRDLHTERGVSMLMQTHVESLEGRGAVERVRTGDGRVVECDFVVVGVGVQPRTRLAAAAGLRVDNGILADEHLRTSAPDVFAAGDVANARHPFYGERVRVEHWNNALHQGPAAALSMLDRDVAYDRLPVLLLRPVRHRHGVRRPRPHLGPRRLSRRSREPRVHRLLADRGPRRGRHELQRVGRHRHAPAAHPHPHRGRRRAPHRSRRAARDTRCRNGKQVGMNRLQALHDAGVSIWLDTLSRELLDSGDFAELIADSAVTGATSNPTIFAKAITTSDLYDKQLRAAGTRSARELFFAIALDDVGRAADLLRPTYEASDGRDGFVSFECTPELADDAEATVEQALDLWSRLARPNVMIKVPATAAGIPAIEELTARGVNVNVTLLFSVARYEQVIDAYVGGLERRVAAGEPVDAIASVASFFVSRVDSKVDTLLPADSDLRGRVAIANAHQAYELYRARFAGERWSALRAAGPHPQRPLWASTGTKDPAYVRRRLCRATDRARRHQHHAHRHASRLRRPWPGDPHARREHRRGRADPPRREGRGRQPDRDHRAAGARRRAVLLRLLRRAARLHRRKAHRDGPGSIVMTFYLALRALAFPAWHRPCVAGS